MKNLITLIFTALALSAFAAKEEPSTQLVVKSNPVDAKITINHNNRGNAPLTITDLPAGEYLIHASKKGYMDAFETVSIQAGVRVEANLELLPQLALLLVHSEPEGAEVSREGVSLGTTPLLVTNLQPGKHRLSIALPGYQTKEIDVSLNGRTPKKEMITLVADSGTIDVTSDPAGAEVMINGIARGSTPCTIERIPGGTVNLEIKQNGYTPHTREIALAAGEKQSINVTLRPLPGNLSIVSIPEGARVYIDNEFKGKTPYTLENTNPGTYRVRVEMAGHTPLARNITLEKGTTATEEFRLEKNTGILSVITAPSGCSILIDGKKRGITRSEKAETSAVSNALSIEDLIAGEHTVEIIRKGFGPQKRKIVIKRDQTTPLQVKLIRQFIPNYEVTTTRSYYKGVLEFINEEGIRIETAPGITQTVPMKDVKKHGPLQEE